MEKTDLNISFSTLIEVSPALGLNFDNRSRIRIAQDDSLLATIQDKTTTKLKNSNQKKDYYVGCLDFLVYELNGQKKFSFLEFNGTSTGGLSSLPLDKLEIILKELSDVSKYTNDPVPVIMVPYFTTRTEYGAPTSKIFHERVLISEYLKQGLQRNYGAGKIVALPDLLKIKSFNPTCPTIVLGHIKDFMTIFKCIDGRLCIFDQPISISIQDNVCSKLFRHFKDSISLDSFIGVNPIYVFAANKGKAYSMFNDFIKEHQYPNIDTPISFTNAYNRDELVSVVLEKLKNGQKVVIKPHASGVGKGVDFFVNQESEADIIRKIDNSVKISEIYQGEQSWVFPYVVCDFVDACLINKKDHPMYKHKFEVRIVVYRENDQLKAFPSIAKVSSKPYDETINDRMMLLNNVSVSTSMNIGLVDMFVLPLTNMETLNTLDLTPDYLEELSSFSINFIQNVIDNIENLREF